MSTRTTRVLYDLVARDRASRTFGQVGASATRLSRQGAGAGAALAKGLKVGAVAAAGLGFSVLKASGDFEKSMNQVRAVSGATGKDFQDLRGQAKELGKTTKFSASQAADGMGFLAMAGFKAHDIMAAMPGVLNLASAGNMDLATSADIASNILTGYGYKAKQTGKIVDVLAKTFTSTNTDLQQLGDAFKYAGPVAHSAGLKFEESAAAIGLMGNAGIQASLAGTSLRGAITRLLAPTDKIQAALDKLGVKVVDSHDKMLPLADIIDQLGKKGATTSDLMTIFGQRAGPAMAALIGQGAPALRKLTTQLEHAGGTADKIAKTQMKGLNGELTSLTSAWEGLMIQIGDTGVLTAATKAVGGVTSALRGLTGFIGKRGVPAVKIFAHTLSGLIPVGSIKSRISQVRSLVSDFVSGLSGTKSPTPRAPIDKFPTTVLGRLTGSPHLGSGMTSPLGGAGAPLQSQPHYGSGQVAPSNGRIAGTSMLSPHGGSGLAAPLIKATKAPPMSAAKKLGQQLRDSISKGISAVDWGKVGGALGKALIGALGKGFDFAKWLGKVLGKTDWLSLGKKVGAAAIPFIIGFVNNLFAPLFSGKFWKKHWKDVLLFAVSIIPVGRIAGLLGKVFAHIPILRLFGPLLKAIEKFGGLMEKGLGRLLKPVGKFGRAVWDGIVEGFTKVFPRAAGSIGRLLGRAALNILGYAGRFAAAGERLIKGLGAGILQVGRQIGKWIGQITGWLVKPFAQSGKWLYRGGRSLVRGLMRGIVAVAKGIGGFVYRWMIRPVVNGFKTAGSWLYSGGRAVVGGLNRGIVAVAKGIGSFVYRWVIRPVVNGFKTAGSWLLSAGRSLISGLQRGVASIAKGIGDWTITHVVRPITSRFSQAGSWLTSAGRHLLSGLKNGIVGAIRGIGHWVKSHIVDPVVNAVKHFFGIHSPSTVFAELGGHLTAGLLKGMATTGGKAIAHLVFGDLPHALSHIVSKGLVSLSHLPKKAAAALGKVGGALSGVSPGASGAMALGAQIAMNRYGWTGDQWKALRTLWMGESGWNYQAKNPSSGAYGIPQALPASKMATAGSDWRTNPATQIKWGLSYIKRTYGSPANALATWMSRSPHWYDSGGYLPQGMSLVMNGTGRKEPTAVFTREQWDTLHALAAGGGGAVEVRVFIGDRELRDIVRVETAPMIRASEQATSHRQKVGRRVG
ncbi:phage tail tape measure protein [Streptomyces beihaiensis]|uniref:phage tail tape measure protein n=1 Tax=Streptomyces beihaiensis TaxID=2984495 RepID=UPI00389A80AB